MIVTTTPNTALDCTYVLRELQWDAAHRVESVHYQAGGKGVNVARSLTLMDRDVCAVGMVGGATGASIRRDLEDAGIDHRMLDVEGESRRTVVVRDAAGRSLELDEPGVVVSPAEWARFSALLASRIRAGDLVTLNGSLPRGVPDESYGELVELAHDAGARVVLDCSGAALREALHARPDVVKPNQAELAALHGGRCDSTDDVLDACRHLCELGAGAVIATRGENGAVAMSSEGSWIFRHPPRAGNPVGAGDTVVAGFVAALCEGRGFAESVRHGVLWARASLAMPLAGWVDAAEVANQDDDLEVEVLELPGVPEVPEVREVRSGLAQVLTSTSDSSITSEHRRTRGGMFQ